MKIIHTVKDGPHIDVTSVQKGKLHHGKFLKKDSVILKQSIQVIDRYSDNVITLLSVISAFICWIPTIQTASNQNIKCEASFNCILSMSLTIY